MHSNKSKKILDKFSSSTENTSKDSDNIDTLLQLETLFNLLSNKRIKLCYLIYFAIYNHELLRKKS